MLILNVTNIQMSFLKTSYYVALDFTSEYLGVIFEDCLVTLHISLVKTVMFIQFITRIFGFLNSDVKFLP